MRENLKCPLCEEETLKHHLYGGTNIYSCTDCPFLGLEYFNDTNLSDLTDYLK